MEYKRNYKKPFAQFVEKDFHNDDNLTHEELFGDLKQAEFTEQEAMNYLEVSATTFRRYIKERKLVANTEIGKSHLYKLTDLRQLKSAIKRIKN